MSKTIWVFKIENLKEEDAITIWIKIRVEKQL